MPLSNNLILFFPAFLIGVAFGSLVPVAFAGEGLAQKIRRIVTGACLGSAVGILLYLLTQQWWPPVIGPFVLCPAASLVFSAAAIWRK
jgi:hypothetical protein